MRVKIRRSYRSQEDFRQFYLLLKQTACPHCKLSGYLNLHGYLRGYDEKACCGRIDAAAAEGRSASWLLMCSGNLLSAHTVFGDS